MITALNKKSLHKSNLKNNVAQDAIKKNMNARNALSIAGRSGFHTMNGMLHSLLYNRKFVLQTLNNRIPRVGFSVV